MEKGQIAHESDRARPSVLPEAAIPSAVDTTPSIPFTPLLASTLGGVAAGFGVPLEVPDRHGCRRHERGARPRDMAMDLAGHERLAHIGPQDLGDGLLRLGLAPRARIEPLRIGRCSRGDGGVQPAVDVALMELGRHPERVGPLSPRINDDDPRAGVGGARDI